MDLGLIGLGKMGGNMRERLRRAGHTVVGYDRNPDLSDVDSLEAHGRAAAPPEGRLGDGAGRRPDPARPSTTLGDLLGEGDIVIDGGNSRWTDDQEHAETLAEQGHRLRRLRRLRRRVGPGERLRADGRRRRGEHRARSSRSSTRSSPRASSAGCTPARSAPGTSPRWSTTASSTPSCRPTPRAGSCSRRSTRSTTSPRCSAPGARAP